MKVPFPAFYLEPQRSPAIPCVTVRPCLVTTLFESTKQAVIELHSLQDTGRVSRVVSFANLCSDLDKAVAQSEALIRQLPALAEKSAAPVAGASAGTSKK